MRSQTLRVVRLLRIAADAKRQPTTIRTCSAVASTSTDASTDTYAETPPLKMISRDLHARLFGVEAPAAYCEDEAAREWTSKIEMPPLRGDGSAFAHFDAIAREQFEPYERLLAAAARCSLDQPPPRPSEWRFAQGWTQYEADGSCVSVEAPLEDVLFFDVEVCVSESQLPTLAIALSPSHWYSWCSRRLVDPDEPVPTIARLDHCIPLAVDTQRATPRIVIGHNVAYDRSRVREQLQSEPSAMRFWDTMSMSIAIHGMAEHQRLVYEKKDVSQNTAWVNEWRLRVCKNSLAAVYSKLNPETSYEDVDKTMQSVFVTESIDFVRQNFQSLVNYCGSDVAMTRRIFGQMYPSFQERFPSPVTYSGMLTMASAYLPITANWRHFYVHTERETEKLNNSAARVIAQTANEIAEQLVDKEKHRDDVWMWVSDWTPKKGVNGLSTWLFSMYSEKRRSTKPSDEVTKEDLKLRSNEIPRLFGLCYGAYPLFYKRDLGWGFLAPSEEDSLDSFDEYESVLLRHGGERLLPIRRIVEMIEANKKRDDVMDIDMPLDHDGTVGSLLFYRLPHTTKEGANVGSPFSKDYKPFYESGKLWATRYADQLREFLDSGSHTRFWGNYRDRYDEQVTIWYDDDAKRGAIAPAIAPAGTITRRAVHKLWLVSANANETQIGSQLKSMIECSEGWRLVGADVDSQEQWIAALFGDSLLGEGRAGATPFSRMQLAGDKANRTDLHSVVAETVGISRGHAKTLNYARLYGSGQSHAAEFLRQQRVGDMEARETSERLFETTKGKKQSYLELDSSVFSYYDRFRANTTLDSNAEPHMTLEGRIFLPLSLCRHFEDWLRAELVARGYQLTDDVFYKHVYCGWPSTITLYKDGIESATFNFLELRAREPQPQTPVLDCRLTRALEPLPASLPSSLRTQDGGSRCLQLVQSSAVDYLHMLLVHMDWLCRLYSIDARFVLSVHDEVRYMVAEKDKYRAAIALNISNMLVRAAISEKLGIKEMPMSIAFFSQVDIDTILRKEVDLRCQMPDGTLVPPGEAVTMKQLLERASLSNKS